MATLWGDAGFVEVGRRAAAQGVEGETVRISLGAAAFADAFVSGDFAQTCLGEDRGESNEVREKLQRIGCGACILVPNVAVRSANRPTRSQTQVLGALDREGRGGEIFSNSTLIRLSNLADMGKMSSNHASAVSNPKSRGSVECLQCSGTTPKSATESIRFHMDFIQGEGANSRDLSLSDSKPTQQNQ